ncbi:helix-turn-helix domain-containing protein [Rhodococcus opacus]|uniref:helix-turn-helix domain-containing protein n=1 Tax=Rhodococcus opacus TaxID=37919 RepID=UPI002948F6D6|nr:helix-turn-helix transcriptional regulator [Rhodococcus opacus]MDV6247208.1 helix-turn-helix transcriptional regulator [Rhodococcus opacus]
MSAIRERLKQLLREIVSLEPSVELRCPSRPDDADLEHSLRQAWLMVARSLRANLQAGAQDPERNLELLDLMFRVDQARTEIRDLHLARNSELACLVDAAIERLRAITNSQDLLVAAGAEIAGLGFRRVLVSLIKNSCWVPESGYVSEDPEMALAMVRVGRRRPLSVQQLVESTMIQDRSPILVENVRSEPRVHAQLVGVTRTRSYVAAPLEVNGRIIAMLHADMPVAGGAVSKFDCMLLGHFARHFAHLLERATWVENLAKLQQTTAELQDRMDRASWDLGSTLPFRSETPVAQETRQTTGTGLQDCDRLAGLSAREMEVLGLMSSGCSNAAIADRLFLSEGTVKAHVKHVLQKTNSANRVEASSLYLARQRAG